MRRVPEQRPASDRPVAVHTARDFRKVTDSIFKIPMAPAGPWDQLTENEMTWIEFIRVIPNGRDPGITVKRVQALRELLDAG